MGCFRVAVQGMTAEAASSAMHYSDGIAVIGFVGQDILGSKAGHQVRCPWRVAGLAS